MVLFFSYFIWSVKLFLLSSRMVPLMSSRIVSLLPWTYVSDFSSNLIPFSFLLIPGVFCHVDCWITLSKFFTYKSSCSSSYSETIKFIISSNIVLNFSQSVCMLTRQGLFNFVISVRLESTKLVIELSLALDYPQFAYSCLICF